MNKDIEHHRATALVRKALIEGEKRGIHPAMVTREAVIDLVSRVLRLERDVEQLRGKKVE